MTFHTPDSILDHGVRRDDTLDHQIRLVTTKSMHVAVSCVCSNEKPMVVIPPETTRAEMWQAYHAVHDLTRIDNPANMSETGHDHTEGNHS